MSVTLIDGIGYSNRTKAAYMAPTGGNVDGKTTISTPPDKKEDSYAYAPWGSNNDLPIKMGQDVEGCGVLSAGLDAKIRIAIGKGPMPFLLVNIDKDGKEDLEYVNDSEISDWQEYNDSFSFSMNSMFDKSSYGWNVCQLLLSRDRKMINRIFRTDVVQARLEKRDNIGYINNLYLSADWETNNNVNSDQVKKIPVLEENREAIELLERTSGYEFAMINRQLRNGRTYYPMPLWYSAKQWVDHTKRIPRLKNAIIDNQITIKYVVRISSQYWRRIHAQWDAYTVEKRQEVIDKKLDEIDTYLSGVDNQYKSLFCMSYIDPVTKQEVADIQIDVIDDKVKDGKLILDSQAGNSEILFAIQVNPALVGAGQPGGAYSNNAGGSNIREAYLTQLMMMEWERRDNAKVFNVVKKYNGWDKRLEVERTIVGGGPAPQPNQVTEKKITPRLVFRYPSNLLTTLDTGKSTKGEVL